MAIGQEAAECRRFPPSIMIIQGHPVISWPVVNKDPRLFCGEWKNINSGCFMEHAFRMGYND